MSRRICCLIAGLALSAASSVFAASGNWTNNASSIWSAATNWNSNPTVPGTAAGDIIGLTADITTARTVTIDTTSRTVGTLNIGDPSSTYAAYTLAASGGASLTFNNSGSGALLAKATAANNVVDTISAPVVLGDNLTIDSAAVGDSGANSLLFSGVISQTGTRSITKNGAGGVQFSAQNTYAGGTVLNAGGLQLGANSTLTASVLTSGPLGTGTLTINGATVLGRSTGRTLHNAIFVGGDFALGVSGNGNIITLLGAMDLGGATRTITSVGAQHVLGGIVSNGGLTKAGAATLEITGTNTFSGDTRIVAGNLQPSASGANYSLQNSTVDMNAGDAGNLTFRGSVGTVAATLGGLKGSRNIVLTNTSGNAVTLTVGNNGQSTTYSGVLSGVGSLIKTNAGTLTLSGANTYTGNTTISGGSLQLGDGGATGSLYASGYIQNDGNLTINRNNAVVQGVDFGGGSIAGTGSVTQAGSGTTTLNLANSYSGATTVSAGKLVVSSDQTGTGAASVADGAALGVTTSFGQWQPTSLTLGASIGCTVEYNNITNAGTTTAPLNPGSVTRNAAVTVNVRSISGAIAVGGAGYPLLGNMGGPTTGYTLGIQPPGVTGHLAVSGTTLTYVVDAVSDIWVSGDITNPTYWDIGASANWAGNAANNTPANTFANGDNVLFNDTVAGPQTVTVVAAVTPGVINVDNTATEYSIISSGGSIAGSTSLNKSGAGTLNLAGTNTYSGSTVLSAGKMNINDGGTSSANSAIGTGTLTINGGTLGNSSSGDVTLLSNNPQNWDANLTYDGLHSLNLGTGTVTPNASRQINVSTNTLAVGGAIGGGAISLTKTGNGILTLSGANTFSGGMTLSAGQLNINNGGSSSANSAIGTGTLTISANTTIDNTSGSDVTLLPNNAQVWSGSFTYAGTANSLNLGTGAVSMPASRTVTVNGNTLTVGGVITGAAGLTKAGAGTLVLSSANAITGTVDLQAGTLAIGSDSALGTGQLNFNGGTVGSTIQSVNGTAHVITNAINFAGAGANAIFGGTGNLKFTATPPGNSTAKTLTVNNPQTEFSGALSGVSARTVAGTGTLILSGANTYSQGTTINPGATLQLGSGGTTGSLSTSGTIVNDGTLRFDRSDALVQGAHFSSAPITGVGAVVQAGPGTTTLNAANTYSGLTTVNNGELFITPAYQGGGTVVVADGARFGVSASSVAISATMGSLTLGSGGATTLDFSYSVAGNPTNAALSATNVTINGTSAIRIGGSFTVGTFPVLKYGSLSGTFASTVDGPRGVVATLSDDATNQILYVTVSSVGSGIVWTGTNSVSPNLWDLNTTTNWLIGGLETVYMEEVPPGDAVTFDDSGSSLVLLSNTVSPARVTINDASVNYTFQGTGQINSLGGLTKVGAATVTMNVPGTFSGSTVLSNGTFSIGANQSLANLSGNSPVTVSANTPTLTLNNTLNTTFSGNISGSLNLTKTGTGGLTLPSSNSISGTGLVKGGTLTLDSGSISQNGYSSVGHTGTDNATLTLKGTATFTNNNDFNVGDVGASVGTLNIDDSASLSVNTFFVGSANATNSTASGTVNQTGGTVTQVSTATGVFAIGGRSEATSIGGVGVYNLSGGVLNATSAIRLGAGGTGTFNQDGGTVNCGVDVNIARFAGSSGTYNLNGGTLRTARVTSSTAANATFNMNGGVLLAREDNTSIITNVAVNVRNGGAVVDTTNFNVTIVPPLQHSSIGGDNAIDGGLTKRGAGVLTLAPMGSYYTGPTVIKEGTLNLSPGSVSSLNNLALTNATLSLTLNGGTATFYALDLNLEGNAALNLNYDVLSVTPVPAIYATGGIIASGTNVINLNAYGLTVGQFTLVEYSGTPLANLDNFKLGILPVGAAVSLSNNMANTSIDLVVTAVDVPTWIPLVASDAAGTSSFNSAGNWLGGNPPANTNGYLTRAFLLRSPADTNAYTFNGAILAIDAGGRFILKGTNGQVITVPNLVMNGGVLDFAVASSDNFVETLAGNITLQSGRTSYLGALGSAAAAESLFVNAPIGGGGNLQLGGSAVNFGGDVGVVVLAATNTYTGDTTVAGGTLLINGANGASAITVQTNAILGGIGSVGGAVTVQTGGKLAPGIPSRGALTAAIGTLTLSSAATVSGTISMKIDRSASPASDRLNVSAVTINPGATLVVTNLGSTNLVAGDTFTLFSSAVGGSFTVANLPPLPSPDLYWTNKLAVNGTLAVASSVTVNTNSTNITATVSGSTLTLSWPADHLGWRLQVQTNSLSAGLGTNWIAIPGSSAVTSTNLTIDPSIGSVFYRMVYP